MLKAPLVASILVGVMLSSPTFGHAKLVTSTPANDARVMAPKTLTLSFNEEVQLASLTLKSAATTIPITLDKSAPSSKTVVVPVSTLTPGQYLVKWTALATDDGHVTKGSFTFTVSDAGESH